MSMMTSGRWGVALGLFLILDVADGLGQENRCVTCHVETAAAQADPRERAGRAHLDEWEMSAHAASGVGCDACHQGNPDTGVLTDAHRTVLSAANPASPVFQSNIPATCGGCHVGQLDAFMTSRHFQVLERGDRRAPTCMTCHGAVAARLPSTREINSTCATCHGPGSAAPISEHQELVRLMRERIQEHRYSLALVRTVIDYTNSPTRRADLAQKYTDAATPLTEAVAAWHAFAFDQAAEPLARAGARIRALVEELTPR